ncbi:MAG: aminotransferase class III-fold pyridoxal phosphate-dependent enzyme, partial [Bacteroidetes bacterium]|nr:aminotransferase class III-fold pyridoxal phosphate-dependent enzyme [Fibrella sp.]
LLLEVGPGNVTSTLARQHPSSRQVPILTSLEIEKGAKTDHQALLKTLGQLWLSGLEPDWNAFYGHQRRRRVELPTYAFDKKWCWVDPTNDIRREVAPVVVPELPVDVTPEIHAHRSVIMRKDLLLDTVKTILEEASGIEMEGVTPDMSFPEIGLDSLSLTQVAVTFKRAFSLPITFRQLNEEYATLDKLVEYLDGSLPADAYQPQPPALPPVSPVVAPVQMVTPVYAVPPVTATISAPMAMQPVGDSALGLIAQQLQILARQVALMQGSVPAVVPAPPVGAVPPAPVAVLSATAPVRKPVAETSADLTPEEAIEIKKPFGATARIERQATQLTTTQQTFLRQLTERYNRKTAASKAYSQQHRAYMADPRVVSGFKPLTKELVYPIVVNRSKGSRLWDLDGNEYIDILNGFGSTMLGYQPDVIKNALHDQVENGYEVGPQHELAGEVSRMVCEFTGFDRAALCSTGSEAVLGAMRIARATTGRSLIVAFTGSYHGIMDEVLVRGTKKLKSYPAASGIMPESVQNMLILDYGTDESLRIIKERAHELAAVLVEPVQSRRPEFRPIEFLKEVRTITEAAGTVLIFDEVITGFRMHPGGAQALFGIKADVASYGKVVGGG